MKKFIHILSVILPLCLTSNVFAQGDMGQNSDQYQYQDQGQNPDREPNRGQDQGQGQDQRQDPNFRNNDSFGGQEQDAPPQPPREVIEACVGKSAEDECKFIGADNKEIYGICSNAGPDLACTPMDLDLNKLMRSGMSPK